MRTCTDVKGASPENQQVGLSNIVALGVGAALGGNYFGWQFVLLDGFLPACFVSPWQPVSIYSTREQSQSSPLDTKHQEVHLIFVLDLSGVVVQPL